MTDRPTDPVEDPAGGPLADRDEAAVRRLLADARHDAPVPDEVAARLDAALGRLGSLGGPAQPDRVDAGAPGEARVHDLTARRRKARALLVAAAAAVAVGIGANVVRDGVDLGGGATSSADSAGGSAATTDGSGSALAERDGGGSAYLSPDLGRRVPLSPRRFGQQVHRLEPSGPVPARPVPDGSTCVPGGFRDAELVPVGYQGSSGLLVFRRPTGDSRVVDLYLCGQEQPVRSLTLPAG